METATTLYDRVKAFANDKGLSIAALETRAQIANGTIAGWRTGRPYADTLKKIADVLEVSIEDLL